MQAADTKAQAHMGSTNTVKVAVLQLGAKAFDTAATLAHLKAKISEAADAGAKLAVFPEALLGGYPKGYDFGARVGLRTQSGRSWFERYAESALLWDGPEIAELCELARTLGIVLHGGFIERCGGTLYCSTLTIGADGTRLAKHRKTMPTAMERLIWGFGDGSTMQAANTEVGILGGAICWENYMPQYRLHQYSQGVALYCAPTVDDRDQWQHTMRHIAYEGRCFVLAACQYSVRADYPADFEIEKLEGDTLIRGGSVIVSPMGEVLAGPVYGSEAIVYAELDLSERIRGQFDLDVVGHYGRPDIFSLTVDTAKKAPVRTTG